MMKANQTMQHLAKKKGGRVLVTGGAGFIGSHLVDLLLDEGLEVHVLDDLSSGKLDNIDSRAAFFPGDIGSPKDVQYAASGAGVVFHLAAKTSVPRSVDYPEESFAANVAGTINVLRAAQEVGARVVFASSSSVYGEPPADGSPFLEGDRTAPESPYAITKLTGEHLCRVWERCHGVPSVSLRLFNVYGPRCAADGPYGLVIPRFIAGLSGEGSAPVVYGDGAQVRDFVHVADVARAFLAASQTDRSGAVINVGSGAAVSVLSVLDAVAEGLGVEARAERLPPRPGDPRATLANIDLASSTLGWRPRVGFHQGVADLCRRTA